MKKAPERAGGLAGQLSSDVGAMRDEAPGARYGGRQFHGERYFALIPQDTKFDRLLLFVALCGQFLAQLAHAADAFAVDRGDDVTCFYARFFRGRTGMYFADQDAFAVGSAEERAELSVEILRINAEVRLPAS